MIDAAVPRHHGQRPWHPAGRRPRAPAPPPGGRSPAAGDPAGCRADARPGVDEELRGELGLLGRALGPVRDLDVLIDHLAAWRRPWETPTTRAPSRCWPLSRPSASRRGRAPGGALQPRLHGAARPAGGGRRPTRRQPPGASCAGSRCARRAGSAAAARVDPTPPTPELHALRIRVKRPRYSVELADPGADAVAADARAIAAAGRARRPPGRPRAEQRLRELTGRHTGAVQLAAGRLIERERERRVQAREAFPEAWARYRRAARKAFR